MALLLSSIQIKDIQIIQFKFETINFEKETEIGNSNLGFQFNMSDLTDTIDNEKQLAAVLIVSAQPEDETEKGYVFDATVRGIFSGTLSDDGDTKDFISFMKVNAFSLLYGYVRNYTQQFSAQTPIGKVNLPCIDMASIADDLAETN